MLVVGAGMAGLLAAAMLRNECSTMIESQSSLPNNHSALLRFRSSVVGDALNIPFKRVQVLKAVATAPGSNPVADMLAYSRKSNGTYSLRSPISARGELEERWIAPPDLISRMAERIMCPIEYDVDFDDCWSELLSDPDEYVISTVPMPFLMGMLDWEERPKFQYIEGFNINAIIEDCDAYVSLYVPDPNLPFSRVSLTGNRLTIEHQAPGWDHEKVRKLAEDADHRPTILQALSLLGMTEGVIRSWEAKVQRYSKILPIDDKLRKRFMLWATEEHRIFSLGRFATWRPGLLLDDLVKDVRVILDISRNGTYAHKRFV